MTATYDLIFSGDIDNAIGEAQVRKNVATLFNIPPEKVEKLFSGDAVVLKSGLEEVTAKRYRTALNKAGALCQLRRSQTNTHQQTATKQVQQKKSKPVSESTPEPETNPTNTHTDTNTTTHCTIAPVGADMQDEKPVQNHKVPDTSHINLKPQSGYLFDHLDTETPPATDTSHITLKPQ